MNSPEPEHVVRTQGLSKVYGETRAVDGLDLAIPPASVFGLLGQNGAGKSTTIRLLLGLVRPSAGSVRLFGRPLADERLSLLHRVGSLIEGPAFYPYLSGAQNLQSLGELAKGEKIPADAVQAALERVGLGARGRDRYRGYSTGMRQRLGIAAAILHDPELVILDEPMSGLDPPAVVLIRELIGSLRDAGKTVLISSHMLHEVELVCDRVAIIERGKVIAQGAVRELLAPDADRLDLLASDLEQAREIAQALDFVRSVGAEADGLRVELEMGRAADLNRALVDAGVAVSGLIPRKRSLEELYHELARGVAAQGGGTP